MASFHLHDSRSSLFPPLCQAKLFSPVSILKRTPGRARNTAFTVRTSTRTLRCLSMGIPDEAIPKKTTRPRVKQVLSRGTANPTVYGDRTVTAELTLVPGTIDETGKRTLDARFDYAARVAAAKCEGDEENETEKGEEYRHDGAIVCQAVMGGPDPVILVTPKESRGCGKARGSGICLSSCP